MKKPTNKAHGKTEPKVKRTQPQGRYVAVDKKAIDEGYRHFWKKRGRDVSQASQWDK